MTHIDDHKAAYGELGLVVLAEQPGHICDTSCGEDSNGDAWHSIDCLNDVDECEASMHYRGCPASTGSEPRQPGERVEAAR